MGQVKCVCISTERKTRANNIHQCHASLDGLDGDIHQGMGERQVSLLPLEEVHAYYKGRWEPACYGSFGENLVVDGLDWGSLHVGALLRAGDVRLEVIRIGAGGPKSDAYKGKKVCAPMEQRFVFCKILQEGVLQEGMEIVKEQGK